MALNAMAPEVSEVLERSEDLVDPVSHQFWTWILGSIDTGNHVSPGSVAALALERAA